jgi:hypothetical protein
VLAFAASTNVAPFKLSGVAAKDALQNNKTVAVVKANPKFLIQLDLARLMLLLL